MREIKFRAWDKEQQEMVKWQHLIDYCDIDYLFGGHEYVPDFEIMQYTGLKDKNGQEIYEGDIVVGIRDDFGRPIDIKATIYYNNGAFRESYYGDCVNRHRDRDGIYLEVIGNIYENSELLGDSND